MEVARGARDMEVQLVESIEGDDDHDWGDEDGVDVLDGVDDVLGEDEQQVIHVQQVNSG